MHRPFSRTLLAAFFCWGPIAPGSAEALVAQETHLLIVAGIGGDEEYRQRFHGWAITLMDAARERFALPAENITYLGERLELDPERMAGRSTRENVASAVEEIAARVGPDDQVWIVLIGHGSFSQGESRFNLPGRDLSAAEYGFMLDRFSTQRVAFINTASASGGFIEELSAPGRTILTATRSGRERNETRFGGYFVQAFAQEGSDLDKDGRVSLLEGYEYARLQVARAYDEENLLLTEHAQLDDNGDGQGSGAIEEGSADGSIARGLFMASRNSEDSNPSVIADPLLRALYAERGIIRERVDSLRSRRSSMETEAYEDALEEILLELALKNREIRAQEGGG
jgi:hypothetical protein